MDERKPTNTAAAAQLHPQFQQAFACHREGKLLQAKTLYEEILKLHPRHFDALHMLGVIAGQTQEYDRALALLARAAEIDPNHAAVHGNRGFAFKKLARWEAALASCDRAIAIKADYAEAHHNRGDVLKELGQPHKALASYDQALAINARYAEAYLNRGVLLDELRRWNEAVASYDRALAVKVDYVQAYYNRGNALKALGQSAPALESYERAIALNPDYVDAHVNRGILLGGMNRWDAALDSFDRAIALRVDCAEAHSNRGNVLIQLKQWEAALSSYDRAIAVRPDYAEAYTNRAAVLQRLKRWDAAFSSCERAIAIRADSAEAYMNRGTVLSDLKQWQAALGDYDRAIAIRSDYAEAHCNRAAVLKELKQGDAALAGYNKAIELNPRYAPAYANRALLFREFKQWDAALADFDRAISLDAELAEAHSNRGDVLRELGMYEATIASFDRALALTQELTAVAGTRLYVKMQICDWHGVEAEVGTLTERVRNHTAIENPLCMMALSGSASLQRMVAERYVLQECPPDTALGPIARTRRQDKIRIGYFSADFRTHPVAQLTAKLFETHDRSRFELLAFSFGPDTQDDMRSRLQRTFDRFIDVRTQSDDDIARLSRNLEIDIAVDLGGFTQHARPRVFALRAAPVQVGYLGFPGTMGASYMDYLIGDRTVIPEDSRQHYCEKIIYLPHSYLVGDSANRIAEATFAREHHGLPPSDCVFCCFNNHYKITAATFDIWMRILTRAQGSVLWLSQAHPQVVKNLKKEAVRRNVDPQRLVFADRLPSAADHLARLSMADLFLDTLPYNAHTTASDALWAGVPVLTCAGEAFCGRVAASLLESVGLPELIAATPLEYERLAVEVAADPARLATVKRKLADNRRSAALFDTELFTRHLEAAYTAIFERYRAELPAEHVHVGALHLVREGTPHLHARSIDA